MKQVLDLFSGIGGFSLGLEKTGGFETAAFCEIEPYPRAVLKRHWPEVPCYEDVRTLTAARLGADGIAVDVICGGFPCQDISTAGKGAGLAGERSGLWSEIARLVGELRPQYVIVENVSALLGRGLSRVLGDLSEIGYDAEWHCIPASYVGAPHRRDRIWIVAYPTQLQRDVGQHHAGSDSQGSHPATELRDGGGPHDVANPNGSHVERGGVSSRVHPEHSVPNCGGTNRSAPEHVAHAERIRPQGQGQPIPAQHPAPRLTWETIKPIDGGITHIWSPEPDVGRVANGIPKRVDRLKALGNAVVPQIPEMIGRAILASEKTSITP